MCLRLNSNSKAQEHARACPAVRTVDRFQPNKFTIEVKIQQSPKLLFPEYLRVHGLKAKREKMDLLQMVEFFRKDTINRRDSAAEFLFDILLLKCLY